MVGKLYLQSALLGSLSLLVICTLCNAQEPSISTEDGNITFHVGSSTGGAAGDVVFDLQSSQTSIKTLDQRISTAQSAAASGVSSANTYTDTQKAQLLASVNASATDIANQAGQQAQAQAQADAKTYTDAQVQQTLNMAAMNASAEATKQAEAAKTAAIAAGATAASASAQETKETVSQEIARNNSILMTMISKMQTQINNFAANTNSSLKGLQEQASQSTRRIEDMEVRVSTLSSEVLALENERKSRSCEELLDFFQLHAGDTTQAISDTYALYPGGANDTTSTLVYCEFQLQSITQTDLSQNIALGRDAYQPSTTSGGVASRAVDGNTDTRYSVGNTCTHTASGGRSMWFVKLDEKVAISQVTLYMRSDGCCTSRFGPTSIHILDFASDFNSDPTNVPDFATTLTEGQCTPGITFSYEAAPYTVTCTNEVIGDVVAVLNDQNNALSLCEVEVYAQDPQLEGGWTLIISDSMAETNFTSDLPNYYNVGAPTNSNPGIVGGYMKIDLKTVFTELYVLNEDQEYHVFMLSDFSGPVILDTTDSYVATAATSSTGIIAGQSPFVADFEVSSVCATTDCRTSPTSSDTTYSRGVLVVLDWSSAVVGGSTIANKAYFGGTAALDAFADRGVRLYAR